VTNGGSNTVSVIEVASNRVVRTIRLSDSENRCRGETIPTSLALGAIAITPNGALAYISSGACALFALHTATNETSAPLRFQSSAASRVAIARGSALAYAGDPDDRSIVVLNTTANSVADRIPLGRFPGALAVGPNDAILYVTNPRDHAVSVVETATKRLVATVSLEATPEDIVVDPRGTLAYVTSGPDRVVAIDTSRNTIAATLSVGNSPQGLAITPDGTRLYVTGDPLSVVDTRTTAVVTTIPVASFGRIAITRDGVFVYVPNGVDNVSVVRTESNAIVATITVPDCGLERDPQAPCVPNSVAIAPAPRGCTECGGLCTSDGLPNTPRSGCAIQTPAAPDGLHLFVLLAAPLAFRLSRRRAS
jgi:YVTN family beta-propeller protein